MNWYKQSVSNRMQKALRRIQDDYADDGVQIWYNGKDAFVSFGDWAESHDECMGDVRRTLGGGKVDYDYEIGSPGPGWQRV